MAQATRLSEAMESLAPVQAADVKPGVVVDVVIVYVTVCAAGAVASVTCTAAVTPTFASSSDTMAVSSATDTAWMDAIVASAVGAEVPSGMVMSYLTSTAPAKRRPDCKRRAATGSQATSTLLASCFEARAKVCFKPSMTLASAQKAAGSSTVIFIDPETTVFVCTSGAAVLLVAAVVLLAPESPGAAVVVSVSAAGSTKPAVGS
mmetsp:Transcript_26955/g.62478  ORF Transcript_26955/g.62478 Transcript_26955/m.62478 type:complete len:205 (+) Transcript_26955:325-939(+)